MKAAKVPAREQVRAQAAAKAAPAEKEPVKVPAAEKVPEREREKAPVKVPANPKFSMNISSTRPGSHMLTALRASCLAAQALLPSEIRHLKALQILPA